MGLLSGVIWRYLVGRYDQRCGIFMLSNTFLLSVYLQNSSHIAISQSALVRRVHPPPVS